MRNLSTIGYVCLILVLVGGINWGIVGLFDFNIITSILGGIARLVYIIVGLAAGYLIYKMFKKAEA